MYHWREFSFSGNRAAFEVFLVVEVAVTAPDSLPCSVLSLEQQLCCCCHPQWGGMFFVLIEDLLLQRKCSKNLKAVCLSSAPGVLDFHCVNCNLFLQCHYSFSSKSLAFWIWIIKIIEPICQCQKKIVNSTEYLYSVHVTSNCIN